MDAGPEPIRNSFDTHLMNGSVEPRERSCQLHQIRLAPLVPGAAEAVGRPLAAFPTLIGRFSSPVGARMGFDALILSFHAEGWDRSPVPRRRRRLPDPFTRIVPSECGSRVLQEGGNGSDACWEQPTRILAPETQEPASLWTQTHYFLPPERQGRWFWTHLDSRAEGLELAPA